MGNWREGRRQKAEGRNLPHAVADVCLLLSAFCLLSVAAAEESFKQAIEPRKLEFPRDHASHAGFQTEWWYFTGNLTDASGREFGYQFTIFRRAEDPKGPHELGRESAWAATEFFLGHLAVSDIAGKQFHFEEDLQRGAAGIAGATDIDEKEGRRGTPALHTILVWLGAWEMPRTADGWTLKATKGDIALDLSLKETIAPVAHGRPGEEGLSRKGANAGQASYYYSVPQLKTAGTLKINDKSYTVSGVSWMDHEFGSNQLSKEQRGWEWFAIQFDDGAALMLYLLRNADGSTEPNSSGTWIDASGRAEYLPLKSIVATPGRVWTSPHSQRKFPLEWRIELPDRKIVLDITPAQDDQEVRSEKSGIGYYEGAVHVTGTVNGKPVKARGYLEITSAGGSTGGLGGKL